MPKQNTNPFDPTAGLQTEVARKRKLAEALMKLGLQGSGQPYTHPMQVLGQLAQALVGRQLDRRATKEEQSALQLIREQVAADMETARSGEGDVATALARSGQYMPDIVTKPLEKQAEYKAVPQPMVHNDQVYDKRDLVPGQRLNPNMNDKVIRGPNGEWMVNPAAVTASAIGNAGFMGMVPQEGAPVPSFRDPTAMPGNPGNNGAPPMPAPEEREFIKQNLNDPEFRQYIQSKYPDWFSLEFGGQ